MDDILALVDQAIARWGTRELVSTTEAIDLLLDIRQAHAVCQPVLVLDEMEWPKPGDINYVEGVLP